MIDPVPLPPERVVDSLAVLARLSGLETLPFHVHEILAAFCFYCFVDLYVAPKLSNSIFPATYRQLSDKKRRDWHIHFVSLIQSVLICSLALWVVICDDERAHMNWKGRIWGYTGASGMVQALAAGYFAWDVYISSVDFRVSGWGALLHAVIALMVTSIGFVSVERNTLY